MFRIDTDFAQKKEKKANVGNRIREVTQGHRVNDRQGRQMHCPAFLLGSLDKQGQGFYLTWKREWHGDIWSHTDLMDPSELCGERRRMPLKCLEHRRHRTISFLILLPPHLPVQWQILPKQFPFSLQGSRTVFLDNIRAHVKDNPHFLNNDTLFFKRFIHFYQIMIISAYLILAYSVLSTGPSVVLELILKMSV